MTPATVPDGSGARVAASRALRHRCPHRDEVDDGTAQLAWTCAGSTIELHSLAAYLDGFATTTISHEALTRAVTDDLSGLPGIADVTVSTTWTTAGLSVRVGPVTA